MTSIMLVVIAILAAPSMVVRKMNTLFAMIDDCQFASEAFECAVGVPTVADEVLSWKQARDQQRKCSIDWPSCEDAWKMIEIDDADDERKLQNLSLYAFGLIYFDCEVPDGDDGYG